MVIYMIIQMIYSHEIISDDDSDLLINSQSLSSNHINLLDADIPSEIVTYQLK